MGLTQQLDQIKNHERVSLISIDAVIHKATQENGECLEAYLSKDLEKTIDESSDAINNVLSATYDVCKGIPQSFSPSNADPLHSTVLFSRWNESIQGLRNIYTRNEKNIQTKDVIHATQKYVESILGLIDDLGGHTTVEDLLNHTLHKRSGRTTSYLPQINLQDYITDVPNFPKPGILFKDITTLIESPEALDYVTRLLASYSHEADVIVGLDARGFIFGSLVAQYLSKKFVIARKPGKLPRETIDISYDLEYGANSLSMHTDSIQPGEKVIVIDDLLATGGTMAAANQIIEELGGNIIGNYFVIELDELDGRGKLGNNVRSLLHY